MHPTLTPFANERNRLWTSFYVIQMRKRKQINTKPNLKKTGNLTKAYPHCDVAHARKRFFNFTSIINGIFGIYGNKQTNKQIIGSKPVLMMTLCDRYETD